MKNKKTATTLIKMLFIAGVLILIASTIISAFLNCFWGELDNLSSHSRAICIFSITFLVMEFAVIFAIVIVKKLFFNPVEKKMKKSHKASERDSMTGLYNKLKLKHELGRYSLCSSLAVIFIDANDLKKINDNFGHFAGDELICSISTILKQSNNLYDAYRFGGDEFVVIIPEATLANADRILKRILDEIDGIDLTLSQHRITVAHGVAFEKRENDDDEINVDDLIHRADMNMYLCKRQQKKPR